MRFVIGPPAVVASPVSDAAAAFPVRRLWCVGCTSAAHAGEMGHESDREPPFFSAKPSSPSLLLQAGRCGRRRRRRCSVNGEFRQRGARNPMTGSVAEALACLSRAVEFPPATRK